jgi:protein-S-isoprenylcysteine O-methyltransferase Ste14
MPRPASRGWTYAECVCYELVHRRSIMRYLKLKAFMGLLNLVLLMGLALFLPGWTVLYWQAWLFLSVFTVCVVAITVYLMANDPELLTRRVQVGPMAEKRKGQKVAQSFASLVFLLLFIVPSVDHRFYWSSVPVYIVAVGDILVAVGLFVVFLVFKENSFTSATIEVSSKQFVVCTGPYAHVRHPMYAGALVMLVGVPLALGSVWGLLVVIPMALIIVWRLLDEESALANDLPGYLAYRNKVRHRLVPWVW